VRLRRQLSRRQVPAVSLTARVDEIDSNREARQNRSSREGSGIRPVLHLLVGQGNPTPKRSIQVSIYQEFSVAS
jgi:hypothetical protein